MQPTPQKSGNSPMGPDVRFCATCVRARLPVLIHSELEGSIRGPTRDNAVHTGERRGFMGI